MAKYTWVVYSTPVPGKEAEYNDWYDNQHIPDLLKVPGFISGRRLELHGPQEGHETVVNLALYEIETDDPDAVMAKVKALSGTPAMPILPVLDFSTASNLLYRDK